MLLSVVLFCLLGVSLLGSSCSALFFAFPLLCFPAFPFVFCCFLSVSLVLRLRAFVLFCLFALLRVCRSALLFFFWLLFDSHITSLLLTLLQIALLTLLPNGRLLSQTVPECQWTCTPQADAAGAWDMTSRATNTIRDPAQQSKTPK